MKKLYINGNIITMNEKMTKAEAFVVENGRFSKVGSNEEILLYKDSKSEVIDLRGKTITPGFNDSHIHLLNYGYSTTKINLGGIDSIEEIIAYSKKYIEDNKIPLGKWVLGSGWNHYFFKEPRFLNRNDLDKISTEHPILFTRVCEHTVTVNSKALEEIGINKNTPNPEGGEIVRDKEGNATGVLKENARYLAYAKLPDPSVKEIKDMLQTVIDRLSKWGVTSVQTDDFETFSSKNWEKIVQAYRELEQEGKLKVRVYEQCLLPSEQRLKEFLDAGYKTGTGSDMFKIGPLKLLIDGSIGPRSALLKEPYNDDPKNAGIAIFTQEELDSLITMGHLNDMQIACHTIGDKAIEMALDSYEKAQKIRPLKDARMGLVHVQIGSEKIYERIRKNNIIVYAQPIFAQSDMHCVEDRIGKERMKMAYKYKFMVKKGIKMPLSSDSPVESANPMDSIYVAVTRKDYSGYPEGGWYPADKLTVEETLKGFTLDSAFASFEENIKGSIEVGKYADFIVLSDDITTIDPEEIVNIKVLNTYLSGKTM